VTDEEMEQVLSLVQMFWMLAILEGTESVEETEIKEKLAELNSPEAVYNFLGFLYDDYLELLSDHIPEEAIQEFMQSHYIKKVWNTSLEKSMMPAALKLFMRYLDEKGIVPGIKSIISIIEPEQKEFLRNLKLYTNPALEEKS
jgi:hypothetical protein